MDSVAKKRLNLGSCRLEGTGRIVAAARWSLAIVLAFSSGGKFFWPTEFNKAIDAYAILPASLSPWASYFVGPLELILAIGIVVPRLESIAAPVVFFLSIVFFGLHWMAILSGTAIPCGCTGIRLEFSDTASHVGMAFVSFAMIVASVIALLPPKQRSTVE